MQDDQGITPSTDFSDLQSNIAKGGKKLSEAVGSAKDQLAEKTKDVVSEGKEALAAQGAAAQNNLSSAIAAFSGAIRAASEHLANSEQRGASKFALEAAGGLDRLSASLKDRPFEEVLSEIRTFGAQNPGVLVGGSVIAGLALGRFVKSSSPSTGSPATGSGTVGTEEGRSESGLSGWESST
ncbi:hypothetical protein [Mesorhizobium sp.]|uniref:hypothetical protein n=1 Tax=Mesorhizobium sp. TaxID=1871066 RepID=UPI000FE6B6C0|nr:hypothetical protein [Mesorhizobium sp.]RWC26021.1 MAG: hypothetical protein EOS27_26490 [Mesorhizobium sp.]TIX21855.1 MAG: hypothetical protein E5V35_28040 [Mesorhizobium sp.]